MGDGLDRRALLKAGGLLTLGGVLAACTGQGRPSAQPSRTATRRHRRRRARRRRRRPRPPSTCSTRPAPAPSRRRRSPARPGSTRDAVRTDIRDGQPGVPLDLAFRVEQRGRLHADPERRRRPLAVRRPGVYSGFAGAAPGQGGSAGGRDQYGDAEAAPTTPERCLRGTQVTDADRRRHLQLPLSRLVPDPDGAPAPQGPPRRRRPASPRSCSSTTPSRTPSTRRTTRTGSTPAATPGTTGTRSTSRPPSCTSPRARPAGSAPSCSRSADQRRYSGCSDRDRRPARPECNEVITEGSPGTQRASKVQIRCVTATHPSVNRSEEPVRSSPRSRRARFTLTLTAHGHRGRLRRPGPGRPGAGGRRRVLPVLRPELGDRVGRRRRCAAPTRRSRASSTSRWATCGARRRTPTPSARRARPSTVTG